MKIRPTKVLLIGCALIVDILALYSTISLARYLRLQLNDPDYLFNSPTLPPNALNVYGLGIMAVWLICIACFHGYQERDFSVGTQVYQRMFYASLVMIALLATTLFFAQINLSRLFFLLLFLLGIPLLIFGRAMLRRVLHFLHRRGYVMKRVLIVGSADHANSLAQTMLRSPALGMEPVGVLAAADSNPEEVQKLPVSYFSAHHDLVEIVNSNQIDLVVFGSDADLTSAQFRRYIWKFERHHTQFAVAHLPFNGIALNRIRVTSAAGMPLFHISSPSTFRAMCGSKRVFDVMLSSIIIILLSPVLLGTAIAVKLSDGGPVFFRQVRVGYDGKEFGMFKFRSMVVDAEARLAELQQQSDGNEVMFKMEKDPRITRVGSFIRRFSIDELPQVFNVLFGDMSLIGPRPPLPSEVEQYTSDEWRRMRVRPGMTGLWQISGRSDLSWQETVRLDTYYVDNWSMLRDLSILSRTPRAVFSSRGAY